MSRYIDADELGKKLDEIYAEVEGVDFGQAEGYVYFQQGVVDAQYAVDDMPTIDAVPVIRCKECKAIDLPRSTLGIAYCLRHRTHVDYDNFCCWAEKGEQNETD